MEDLMRYIYEEAMKRSLEWHPYDVVILGMYNFIAASVRDQHDTLVVTRTHVEGRKEGATLQFLDISKHEQDCEQGLPNCTSFRTALELIIKHDKRVRRHLRAVEETPDSLTYRFVSDENQNNQNKR